jgi:predicted DNA-binding transcriptional regulator YafY
MRQSRLTRLIELLTLLQSGRGHNTKNLADLCRVSRRTIFRDLDVLRQAGVPLRFDAEYQRFYLTAASFLPPTSFTAQEALTLLVLCHELGEQRGVPFFSAARQAALKLESCLPKAVRDEVRQVASSIEIRLEPKNALAQSERVYQQLLSAIGSHRCVRIRYQSLAEQKAISTRLSPYRLLYRRRSWYVIGRSSLHRDTRTFNVGRITSLEILDDRFRVPSGFSLQRHLRNAWQLIPEPGRDVDVELRFQPKVAINVAEVAWHKTQRVKFHRDGTLTFRVRVSGINEIAWWILGYGDQVEVVKPRPLRQLIAAHVQRMSTQYAKEIASLGEGAVKGKKRRKRR